MHEGKAVKVCIYARVSTALDGQNPENQLIELRRYCDARGWAVFREYVDRVSGSKESRPALNELLADAKQRRYDAVLVWRLDRLGRSLRHLLFLIDEFVSLDIAFVSLNEGIDTNSASGRLSLHILGAMAEFERSRISERVKLGLARARKQGVRLGRKRPKQATDDAIEALDGLSLRAAAQKLGVSKSFIHKFRASRESAIRSPQAVATHF
jgi:DNA invertase Pin-like site-specific DNA recombinase